jgi:hypothetical protein
MPLSRTYGETAIPWSRILRNYDEMVSADPVFTDISNLAHALASSGFVAAGLCGLTSHSDLLLGQSTRVLDNPYLHIAYDFDQRRFVLTYLDGSAEPWSRIAEPAEAFDVVHRFLTQRARWFTDTRL